MTRGLKKENWVAKFRLVSILDWLMMIGWSEVVVTLHNSVMVTFSTVAAEVDRQ